MIDKNGYRLNVGIIIANTNGQLFWGKRTKSQGWQFPQGGVNPYETLEETMFRELHEEVGLTRQDVKILASTKHWINYQLPEHMQRKVQKQVFLGQKQRWFLLLLTSPDEKFCFNVSKTPEFTRWNWVDYWYPLKQVVYFKRNVYRNVLREFETPLKRNIKQNMLICSNTQK